MLFSHRVGGKGPALLVEMIQLPPNPFLRMAGGDVAWISVLVNSSRDDGSETPLKLVPAVREMPDTLRVPGASAPLGIEVLIVPIDQLAVATLNSVLPEDERDHLAIIGNSRPTPASVRQPGAKMLEGLSFIPCPCHNSSFD